LSPATTSIAPVRSTNTTAPQSRLMINFRLDLQILPADQGRRKETRAAGQISRALLRINSFYCWQLIVMHRRLQAFETHASMWEGQGDIYKKKGGGSPHKVRRQSVECNCRQDCWRPQRSGRHNAKVSLPSRLHKTATRQFRNYYPKVQVLYLRFKSSNGTSSNTLVVNIRHPSHIREYLA
jgi:hypothetical protein